MLTCLLTAKWTLPGSCWTNTAAQHKNEASQFAICSSYCNHLPPMRTWYSENMYMLSRAQYVIFNLYVMLQFREKDRKTKTFAFQRGKAAPVASHVCTFGWLLSFSNSSAKCWDFFQHPLQKHFCETSSDVLSSDALPYRIYTLLLLLHCSKASTGMLPLTRFNNSLCHVL